MKSQQEFLEGLQDLIKIAKTNGDVLTQDEIKQYFSDYELDEQKMTLIGAFMAENQIRVKGVLPEVTEELEAVKVEDQEPSAALSMYMEELKDFQAMEPEEEQKLALLMEQGDEKALEQLVDGNLEAIVQLAEAYRGRGIQINDLIQEGNLAMFCAMKAYNSAEHGNFHEYAMAQAKEAMNAIVEENEMLTRPARKMAHQVNQMNDLATAMAEELGREAKPEELAEKMHMTEEQIKDLMRISLDALSVYEAEKH